MRLGRYELLRALAAGGMGEIYLAEHTGLAGFAKRVALKRIRPCFSSDTAYVQLFLNEARLGSFLNHPNIVHIFDVGHEGSDLWMVMEYIDGVDLKRLVRRSNLAGRPLQVPELCAVFTEVLAALEEAHRGGPLHGAPIVHRDMSPENILIARTGAVKVLDFGLAKWIPQSTRVPSLEGKVIFGKVRYMPPEQLRGHFIDVRADLFALGVVMYEVLSGCLPFGRGSAQEVLDQIMAGRPPSPTGRLHREDPELDAIIFKALEPEPNKRFLSATQMRQSLVSYLQHSGAVLPLERLRHVLQPEQEPEAHVDLNGSHTRSEAVDLSVVERCGKCGGPFRAIFVDGMIMDQCTSCGGTWLDIGELVRLLGAAENTPENDRFEPPAERAPLDHWVGSCPVCRIGLLVFEVPGQPASIEVCERCLGTWFDRNELDLLNHQESAAWLRRLLHSMELVSTREEGDPS